MIPKIFDLPRDAAQPAATVTVSAASAPATEPVPPATAIMTTASASAAAASATVTVPVAPVGATPASIPTPAPAATPGRSPLEAQHDPYFVQRVEVGTELAGLSRLDVFASLCAGKRVLHVGCADWPVTAADTSLHIQLEQFCAVLDGLDARAEALDRLRPFVKGNLFTDFAQITEPYDLVLAPAVMEQVSDVAGFLAQLEAIDASCYFLSVPDAFQCRAGHFDFIEETETFVEVVHPDHNVWYTPYTFTNTIRKYSGFKVERLWFFNRISILALLSKPSVALAA